MTTILPELIESCRDHLESLGIDLDDLGIIDDYEELTEYCLKHIGE